VQSVLLIINYSGSQLKFLNVTKINYTQHKNGYLKKCQRTAIALNQVSSQDFFFFFGGIAKCQKREKHKIKKIKIFGVKF